MFNTTVPERMRWPSRRRGARGAGLTDLSAGQSPASLLGQQSREHPDYHRALSVATIQSGAISDMLRPDRGGSEDR